MWQKDRNGILWNRVDIEKVPGDERVGTGFLNLIIYQIDISLTLSPTPPPVIENHFSDFLEFFFPNIWISVLISFLH